MRVRVRAWASALSVVLALAGAAAFVDQASPAGAVTTAPASSLGLLAIAAGDVSHLGDVTRYAYVVMQSWEPATVTSIHRASPSTRVIAYFEGAATQLQSCPATPPAYAAYNSAPVNYCWVRRWEPNWFLRNRSGRIIRFADHPSLVAMDIGNPAYQRLWASNALNIATRNGYDGVYIDDVSMSPTHGMSGTIAKYTNPQYGAAMVRFASYVGDRVRYNHKLAIANEGVDPWVGWQATYGITAARHVNSVAREHSVRWGQYCGSQSARFTDPYSQGNPALSTIQRFRTQLQNTGAGVFGIDYGSSTANAQDLATMTYGRASFLLTWNGKPGSAYFFRPCAIDDAYSAAWTTNPGLPTGPLTVRQGAWTRTFSHGLVLLNPSPTHWVNYTLPAGSTYRDPWGIPALLTVALAPRTASVLTN